MSLQKLKVATISELHKKAQLRGAIYGGSTSDIDGRTSSHKRSGFRGTLYYAKTRNMKGSENRLLKWGFRHNQLSCTGRDEEPGYIYVIVGRKMNA